MSMHGDDDLKGWRVSHKVCLILADLGNLDW